MRRRIGIALLFAGVVVACGCVAALRAPRPAGPRLRYEVTPAHGETTVGDNASFVLRLHNDGDRPVTVFWPGEPYADVYRFAVTRRDGTPMPALSGPSAPIGLASGFREILPGKHLEYSMYWSEPRMCANCQEYVFTEPGEYIVRPSFAALLDSALDPKTGERTKVPGVWVGTLDAKPVSLTVKAPGPGPERGRIRLEGQVVDKAGKPVAGARVEVRRPSVSPNGFAAPKVACSFSRADGRFAFHGLREDSPVLVLETTHPHYRRACASLTLALPKTRHEVHMEMDPGGVLRGQVRDSQGRPLEGVRAAEEYEYNRYVYTDKEGRFELRGTAAQGVHVWKDGYVGRYAPASSGETAALAAITLLREGQLACSGQALFADGAPAATLRLSFSLKEKGGRQGYAAARTDAEGRFEAVLSNPGTFVGTVWAEEGEAHETTHGRWRTSVDGLAPGVGNVKLVFENRGVLEVPVEPANKLPASLEFQVNCYIAGPPDNRWETIGVRELGAQGGTARFEKLAPGRYRVEAFVAKSYYWRWHQEAEVSEAPGKLRAVVPFPLPELLFGNLRARILRLDGKTPFREGDAKLSHSPAWGGVTIRNGVIELKDVAVGAAYLHWEPKGCRRTDAWGIVRAGETTDLGDIVLKRERVEPGWVEGRVLYEDGTPALGARLQNCSLIMPERVGAGGKFRKQLPGGTGTLVVMLGGAPGWPRLPQEDTKRIREARDVLFGYGWDDTLLVPVDVRPGRTVARDVILRRTGLGTIRVDWRGKLGEDLGIIVAVDDKGQRFVRLGSRRQGDKGTFILPDVPRGDTVVVVHADGYRGYREVKAEEGEPVLTFDPAESGTIVGRAVRPDGKAAPGVSVELRPAPLAWYGPVQELQSAYWPISSGTVEQVFTTAEDGSFRIPGVGPGRYLIQTRQHGPSNARIVKVATGKTTTLELVTDASSQESTPPLRTLAPPSPAPPSR